MAMFENFPYTDMHNLNLDWIIKIAKDFLDQYTHIQQLISDGEESLQNLTTEGLQQLQDKANELESALNAWYEEHSEDISEQLASALSDLNSWYTLHQNYLDETLVNKINAFNTAADTKAAQTIASIPDDYTTLANKVTAVLNAIAPTYDSANAYRSGDMVWKDNVLLRCRTPITANSVYNSADWMPVLISDILEDYDNLVQNIDRQIRSETGIYENFNFTINTGHMYAIRDNAPTLIEQNASCCTLINVYPGWALKIRTSIFSWMDSIIYCDSNDKILMLTPRVTATTTKTYEIIVPGFCTKLYINSALTEGITIQKLNNKTNLYEYIHAENKNLWVLDSATFGVASFVDNNPLKVSVGAANGGLTLGKFFTNASKVRVRVRGNATCNGLRFYFRYFVSTPAWYNVQKYSDIAGSNFDITFEFDAAYYIQYHNAENFDILVNTSESSGTIEIYSCTINVITNLQESEYYDDDFNPMMLKIVNALEIHDEAITNLETTGIAQTLFNGNGKYTLGFKNNGNFVAIPNIPRKTLFIGNSLLCGMDTNGEHGGMFGMAATDPYHDYAYLVEQNILDRYANATFTKLNGAAFEQCETFAAAAQWLNDNASYFASDLDLIVIQLGDNVNNDTRKELFKTTFPRLIRTIKLTSDAARLIVVTGWFNHGSLTEEMAIQAGCEYISISDLDIPANQGVTGSTVTYYDGTTISLPAAWATHPGNVGMEKIAERIVKKLNMDY